VDLKIIEEAARNRYIGAVSLGCGPDGKRIRRKVSGQTKQEVRAKHRRCIRK
jgi:hypothetical protein